VGLSCQILEAGRNRRVGAVVWRIHQDQILTRYSRMGQTQEVVRVAGQAVYTVQKGCKAVEPGPEDRRAQVRTFHQEVRQEVPRSLRDPSLDRVLEDHSHCRLVV
jgi:hypothetical protein